MEFVVDILIATGLIHLLRKTLETAQRIPDWDRILSKIWLVSIVCLVLHAGFSLEWVDGFYWRGIYLMILYTVYLCRDYRPAWLFALALLPLAVTIAVSLFFKTLLPAFYEAFNGLFTTGKSFSSLWLIGFSIYAYAQNKKELKSKQQQEEQLRIAEGKKAELEVLVLARTTELSNQKKVLEKALEELQTTQDQLVQSEKLASLGELTAGIAHEIQNPLHFVNNFSQLSVELAEEIQEEIAKPAPDMQLIVELLGDLTQNQEKINHHGKRAAGIVSGMLQHARSGTGKKEITDLNALAEEYIRLSYHGLRAKDKTFHAEMSVRLDPKIGAVKIVPEEMGRVLLNLFNNAFYAVNEKQKQGDFPDYVPTVWLTTQKTDTEVEIRVRDNGTGISDAVKAKIFQPFFTTKPAGQGTGLGLSLAYDIVTKGHGGNIEVHSSPGTFTEFIIHLPDTEASAS